MDVVVPRRCEEFVHQVMDGEAVLYDQVNRHTHRMNATALVVWQACDGRSTTCRVARQLAGRYDIPFHQALEDIEQLLASFAQVGLVRAGEN